MDSRGKDLKVLKGMYLQRCIPAKESPDHMPEPYMCKCCAFATASTKGQHGLLLSNQMLIVAYRFIELVVGDVTEMPSTFREWLLHKCLSTAVLSRQRAALDLQEKTVSYGVVNKIRLIG